MKIEFLDVTGSRVHVRMTMHASDGKESNQTMDFDVGSSSSYSGLVIPANSKVGNTVYIGGTSVIISGESTRTYTGVTRTVLSATYSQGTYYWDKQSGVAVEVSTAYGGYTSTALVAETSLWSPGFWAWTGGCGLLSLLSL
jgi:hypothetical protein